MWLRTPQTRSPSIGNDQSPKVMNDQVFSDVVLMRSMMRSNEHIDPELMVSLSVWLRQQYGRTVVVELDE